MQAREPWKQKAQRRNEENIGKRAIRRKNNRRKVGKAGNKHARMGRSGSAGAERTKYKPQS